jgi:hypothetical protein
MKLLQASLLEVYGLFVDDGSLALAILVWVALAFFVFGYLPVGGVGRAALFFAGLVVLLVENVWRAARKRRRSSN